jgi:hypothetical protein
MKIGDAQLHYVWKMCIKFEWNLNEICSAVFEINSGQIASMDKYNPTPKMKRKCS